jgi:hypothetical protein
MIYPAANNSSTHCQRSPLVGIFAVESVSIDVQIETNAAPNIVLKFVLISALLVIIQIRSC